MAISSRLGSSFGSVKLLSESRRAESFAQQTLLFGRQVEFQFARSPDGRVLCVCVEEKSSLIDLIGWNEN